MNWLKHFFKPSTITLMEHRLGSEDAPVQIVFYGDYECPYTLSMNEAMNRVYGKLGDKFSVVYRHFPLTDRHPHAYSAAEAAEAASAQGKFWEIHNRLFSKQSNLEERQIRSLAFDIGLDMAQYDNAMETHQFASTVEDHMTLAKRQQVRTTPTLFVNAQKHHVMSDEELMTLIKNLLP